MEKLYQTSYHLEGITHAVAKELRLSMKRLNAQAVTCFLGHEHSPGDLRLIYQKGVIYPEALYGVLSRRSLRHYYSRCIDSDRPHFERYKVPEEQLSLPLVFRGTPAREQYTASLQRVSSTGGCPDAAIFFNFRREISKADKSDLKNMAEEEFAKLDERLQHAFGRFWDAPLPHEFRKIMRAADAIGGRLFFEMKDFDFMTRGLRDRAFIDLVQATLQADPTLSQLPIQWHLFAPVGTSDGHVDKLARISSPHLSPLGPDILDLATHSDIETWVFKRNSALRFSPQCMARGDSGFANLLNQDHFAKAKAVACIPFSDVNSVTAITTIIVTDCNGYDVREITAAQNRVIRSLWFNARRLTRAWSQGRDRRHAASLKMIVNCFTRPTLQLDCVPDDAASMSELFRDFLGAASCTLWEFQNGIFRVLSRGSNLSQNKNPRPDGWSNWVAHTQRPVAFFRDGEVGERQVNTRVMLSNSSDRWVSPTHDDLKSMPSFRESAWETDCHAQLALPLRLSTVDHAAAGVVWIHFNAEQLPAELDLELAIALADEIARIVEASRLREIAVQATVEQAKHMEFERTLSHLRHETLKLIPEMIKKAVTDHRQQKTSNSSLQEISDCADLLEANLLLYTTLDTARLPSLEPCDVVSAIDRGVVLAALSRNRRQPEVKLLHIPEGPISVVIDRRLLWGVLLNLVTNARLYRYRGKEGRTDENIYISVDASADDVMVAVDDAGRGMSEEEKAIAGNERFSHDPSRGDQGAGMGLLICKKAINSFGDWSISDSGRGGTKFTITLKRM